jgi:hypothetical protein
LNRFGRICAKATNQMGQMPRPDHALTRKAVFAAYRSEPPEPDRKYLKTNNNFRACRYWRPANSGLSNDLARERGLAQQGNT